MISPTRRESINYSSTGRAVFLRRAGPFGPLTLHFPAPLRTVRSPPSRSVRLTQSCTHLGQPLSCITRTHVFRFGVGDIAVFGDSAHLVRRGVAGGGVDGYPTVRPRAASHHRRHFGPRRLRRGRIATLHLAPQRLLLWFLILSPRLGNELILHGKHFGVIAGNSVAIQRASNR
jgi:hypothetical protein